MRLMYIDEQFMYESDTLLEVGIHGSFFLREMLAITILLVGYCCY